MKGLVQRVRTTRALRASEAGFSLIEIIIVLGILGTLIAVLVTNLAGGQASAKKKETTVKAGQIQAQLLRFQTDMGRMPSTAEGLDALVNNPGSAKWTGPYLSDDDVKDAWGIPFEFELTSRGPQLTSAGLDTTPGTEDDQVYISGRLVEADPNAAPQE